MNYYKHHLGDYDGATVHLSWDEDMAYTRLLRAYYRREKAIPAIEAYRLVRASSKAQRAAVDAVLAEFFERSGDDWHNKRADEEISQYLESEEGRSAKKDNERERQHRHRERRKALFAALREHNRVPPYDTITDELQAMFDAVTKRVGHAPVTRDATANHNQNQNQNQEPEKEESKPLASSDKSLSAANGSCVAYIPLNDGTEFGISETFCKELDKLYPAVDALQTLNEIRAWNLSNPKRRKTKSGVLRHVNIWFAKLQDKAPG